jgi:cytochrome c556
MGACRQRISGCGERELIAFHGNKREDNGAWAMRVKLSVIAILALTVVGASAQDTAGIISSRKDHFHQIGASFKAINDQIHAGSPNWQTIRSSAQMLAQLTSEITTWFPTGSGPESGAKTHAKAEIWTKGADFQQDARLAHAAAQDLLKASGGSDVSVVATSAKALGQRCAACHSEFRERE